MFEIEEVVLEEVHGPDDTTQRYDDLIKNHEENKGDALPASPCCSC